MEIDEREKSLTKLHEQLVQQFQMYPETHATDEAITAQVKQSTQGWGGLAVDKVFRSRGTDGKSVHTFYFSCTGGKTYVWTSGVK